MSDFRLPVFRTHRELLVPTTRYLWPKLLLYFYHIKRHFRRPELQEHVDGGGCGADCFASNSVHYVKCTARVRGGEQSFHLSGFVNSRARLD